MTREEAKQLLPVIQAYAEGEEVQYYYKNGEKWCGIEEPSFNPNTKWRIKPEPKYRPFENAKECWNEMLKHQPFGWIKVKDQEIYLQTLSVDNEGVMLCDYEENTILYDYNYAATLFTFIDDKPFSINLNTQND
jgi:hypothetical protein